MMSEVGDEPRHLTGALSLPCSPLVHSRGVQCVHGDKTCDIHTGQPSMRTVVYAVDRIGVEIQFHNWKFYKYSVVCRKGRAGQLVRVVVLCSVMLLSI